MNNTAFTKIAEIAKSNSQFGILDKYNDTICAVRRDPIRKFAVLGEMNSGKSTLLNTLCGKDVVPVSILSNTHPSYVYIEQADKDYGFAEIGINELTVKSTDPCNSPLWTVDAAVYVISALNPLTKTDINVIKDCVNKGIPCTLVLNKLSMVDEEEREQTLQAVKGQMRSVFGDDHIIVFDPKNAADTADVIISELKSSEECREYKEYALTVDFAKELMQYLSERHLTAQKRYDSLKESKTEDHMEDLAWDEININIEKSKTHLLTQVDTAVYEMFSKCSAKLVSSMNRAQDPKIWWQKSLRTEMKAETEQIGLSLNKIIDQQINEDKKYLINTVKEKFDIDIKVSELDRKVNVHGGSPSNINSKLDKSENNGKKAFSGLVTSAIVMAGGLLLPLSTPISIVTCSIAGVAMVGTGFWTYFERQKTEEEKKRIITVELDKYISQCRDYTMENIKGYIKFSYDNLLVSAKDAQLLHTGERNKPSDEERSVMTEMFNAAKDKDAISDILASL